MSLSQVITSILELFQNTMNVDITLDEFDKICRLCLACGDLRPLVGVDVVDVLKSITEIEVRLLSKKSIFC